MDLFILISFIGTMVLMTVHALDYVAESMLRPEKVPRARMPDEEARSGDSPVPFDIATHYEQAA